MTTPRDPQQPHDPLEHDLGADYEAFLTEATRALEPSAADAARVRAGLDASLASPLAAPGPSAGGGGASTSSATLGVSVRWVGLAAVALAVLGGVAVSLNDAAPAASSALAIPSSDLGDRPTAPPAAPEPDGRSTSPGQPDVDPPGGESAELPPTGQAPSSDALTPATGATGNRAAPSTGAPAAPEPARGSDTGRARPRVDAPELPDARSVPAEDSTETGNPPAAGGPATITPAPEPALPSLLAREAARLLRARNALSAGQVAEALTLTTRLPEGDPLSPERRAIRVRALCALGRTGDARQVAGTLGDGNGPSAAAVRASCVGADDRTSP